MSEGGIIKESWKLKNLSSNCCKQLIREKLEQLQVVVHEISLGRATVSYDAAIIPRQQIEDQLNKYGIRILEDQNHILVEQIKIAVIELVHHLNNVNSIVRKSDYLVEKLGYSYPYLAKLFSEQESTTLEKYIINQKIERIKNLLDEDEFSLSEIAYMMDYSSVQYLSNQFKKITGITVTQYKEGSELGNKPLEELS